MASPDELDADGKAVFGEASANDCGGLSRLIEHGSVCRDVQEPAFVRGGLIRREAHDVSRGGGDQIEWKSPLDYSGFCTFQFVARLFAYQISGKAASPLRTRPTLLWPW